MKTVNIHEAKTHLSRLIEEAAAGEEVVIAKAGKPMVKLVPVASLAGPRTLGLLAGQVREAEDCWAPDPEIEASVGWELELKAGRREARTALDVARLG